MLLFSYHLCFVGVSIIRWGDEISTRYTSGSFQLSVFIIADYLLIKMQTQMFYRPSTQFVHIIIIYLSYPVSDSSWLFCIFLLYSQNEMLSSN